VAFLRIFWLSLVLALGALPAIAQDIPEGVPPAGVLDIVDEVRVGLHYHSIYWTMLPLNPQDWYWNDLEDVSLDVLFTTPDVDAFRWIGSPRPEVGATINTAGYDSLYHLGLTWQLPVFDTPVYLEGTFGAAMHDGYLDNPPAGYREFGCRVNFYERFGVGAHVTENVTATLTYEHTSNAGLCEHNAGLSNFGVRLGWKF
jgi:lipid A 3-O-deacylase